MRKASDFGAAFCIGILHRINQPLFWGRGSIEDERGFGHLMDTGRKGRGIRYRLAAALLVLSGIWAATVRAENSTATVIRMRKTEGTVELRGSTGKAVSLRQNMRLYNGYGVSTEEESYAWIDLDSTKLLKLDALSGTSIRKRGRKLEVLLEFGSLFFDVTAPLEDSESLNIRTSSMVLGVRGTSGWVEVIDGGRTRVGVLEGTVLVSVTDSLTGQVKTEYVSGGETVLCVVYEKSVGGG